MNSVFIHRRWTFLSLVTWYLSFFFFFLLSVCFCSSLSVWIVELSTVYETQYRECKRLSIDNETGSCIREVIVSWVRSRTWLTLRIKVYERGLFVSKFEWIRQIQCRNKLRLWLSGVSGWARTARAWAVSDFKPWILLTSWISLCWRDMSTRETLDSLLASVLGIPLDPRSKSRKLEDVDAQQYVLTPDYLLKVRKWPLGDANGEKLGRYQFWSQDKLSHECQKSIVFPLFTCFLASLFAGTSTTGHKKMVDINCDRERDREIGW